MDVGVFMKKIGIITGASSGMGKEFVLQLDTCLKSVDELWIIARRKDKLEELKSKVRYSNLRVLAIDLCKEEDLNFLSGLLEVENPSVRIFVNCAGVGYSGMFSDLSRKQIEDMTHLNMHAFTSLLHIVLPYMTSPGNIIQLASSAAFLPQKEFAVYAASKSYVLNLSRALRMELKEKGIYLTTVCPGPVNTEFLMLCNGQKEQKWYKKLVTVEARPVVHQALVDAKKKKALSIYGIPMKVVYGISHLYF